jgi:RAB protein geranylgeranyltransferase component A
MKTTAAMLCLLWHAAPAVQTWRNWDLNRMTMHELYAQFGLDVQTIDFVGHALALHQNDAYMMQVGAGAGQGTGWMGRASLG